MYLRRREQDRDPAPRARWIAGWALLGVAALATGFVASLPAPYVIEQPGPVFDVLDRTTVDGEEIPLISIPVEETYPTAGALRMLTVYATPPQRLPSWVDVALAWLDPKKAVHPVEAVYPPGLTREQNAEQARIAMDDSKLSAIAAALDALGHPLEVEFSVAQVQDDAAARGILLEGDIIRSLGGRTPDTLEELRAAVAANGVERPLELDIVRGGEELVVEVTPRWSEAADGSQPSPVLGILVASDMVLPFTVDIQLDNVGGPSAGMMFALGVYDKLTPGALTDGEDVAGTGTIDVLGRIGAIGGIQQKMWGAVEAGSDWFLAPVANCPEVIGAVPDGLRVIAVATLDEAIQALETIAADGEVERLPTCEAALAR